MNHEGFLICVPLSFPREQWHFSPGKKKLVNKGTDKKKVGEGESRVFKWDCLYPSSGEDKNAWTHLHASMHAGK